MIHAPAYHSQFSSIFSRNPQLSNILPSQFAERDIVIRGKGKVNYDFNPYCREIIDTMAPTHPARRIAVMKGSQITFTTGVIIPALGYIIKEDPHNTGYMVGTDSLVKNAVERLDLMIADAKLQDYISYQAQRKRNTKSGNTDDLKSFMNGYIKTWAATNPKAVAQMDWERIFLDDFDAMTGRSKVAGSLLELITMRAASYKNTFKLMMASTPLLKASSNIEPAYLAGDQRKYFLECPCCHEPIIIKWKVDEGELINSLTEEKANNPGGIIYGFDNHGRVDKKSVVYVCYRCGGAFNDKNKQNMLRAGIWTPTATPAAGDDYFSYWIPSLYAPVGMFDWADYAEKYHAANPIGQPRDEYAMQTLTNTCFAETYEPQAQETSATEIMKNQRSYLPFTIPEQTSIDDGNGRIIMLTLATDMNGKMKGFHGSDEDDVRLDWEILAHSENESVYSVAHGSIGTFIPLEGQLKIKEDREKWTYEEKHPRSVWPELTKVMDTIYETDTGRKMAIAITGVDSGNYTNYAYDFMTRINNRASNHINNVVCLKGDKEYEFSRFNVIDPSKDAALFKDGVERKGLYILQVGLIKDHLAQYMRLKWHYGEAQPAHFMNYPESRDGLYTYAGYFTHYEAEHRTTKTSTNGNTVYIWKKKKSNLQNHFYDVRIYNMALRDIMVKLVSKDPANAKIKNFGWKEYVERATGRK